MQTVALEIRRLGLIEFFLFVFLTKNKLSYSVASTHFSYSICKYTKIQKSHNSETAHVYVFQHVNAFQVRRHNIKLDMRQTIRQVRNTFASFVLVQMEAI